MRVFVTGATGLIGKRLMRDLLLRGDQVVALTRDRRRLGGAIGVVDQDKLLVVEGDPAQSGPWQEYVAGCDAVVALAGEPIAGHRWSASFKERIERSRVDGMTRLCEVFARLPAEQRPSIFLAGSAVGYYGPRGDEVLTEDDGPGDDFLAQICQRWEAATEPAAALGLRVVRLRTGVVLGDGGALEKMLPAFRMFLGGPLGSGRQYMSWIHQSDVAGLLLLCLRSDAASGPINLCSERPVTMREFATTLGEVLHRPSILPVPALAVRALMGESADMVLTGQRVLPRRATQLGYHFRFPDLKAALRDLLDGR